MKKLNCLLVSFLMLHTFCLAQTTSQYKWGSLPPMVVECDANGNIGDEVSKIPVEPNTYFRVISKKNADTVIAAAGLWGKIEKDGSVIIKEPQKFIQYNITSNRTRNSIPLPSLTVGTKVTPEQLTNSRKYFLIPVSMLGTKDAIPVYQTGWKSQQLTLGAFTLPFKLRIHSFDFAKDLNVGSVVGVNRRTHPTRNNFINYLFNISVSVNDIDELSARGAPADQLPAKNIAALTLAGGVVWQFGKGQVGAFYGFDFMSHNNWVKYGWIYNKRPWVGIGFGINLFQKEDLNAGPGDEISNYKK